MKNKKLWIYKEDHYHCRYSLSEIPGGAEVEVDEETYLRWEKTLNEYSKVIQEMDRYHIDWLSCKSPC